MVPTQRIRRLNDAPVRPDRAIVLYWMIAQRRTVHNFALERAVEHAAALKKPLVVFEPLRAGYRWASDRLHQFVIDGMRDNAARLAAANVTYYPYLEPSPGDARGLLAALAGHAALLVTDDFPSFFLPRMVEAAATRVDVCLEVVDGNGLLPLSAVDTVFPTAYAFRRVLQRVLPAHLDAAPTPDPLRDYPRQAPFTLPEAIRSRWAPAALDTDIDLARFPIDHRVRPGDARGGAIAARARLDEFVATELDRYAESHSVPDLDVTSRLSPYLHWGHLSVHEVFEVVMRHAGWTGATGRRATGAREGWWGVNTATESFLDELITWRELGYNMSAKRADYDTYESLPAWALRTLDSHRDDPRDEAYTFEQLEHARTGDALWNAAQRQLVRDGRIHNYLRMLWGKKILEWSPSPELALAWMIELNNKYALDGRNPNSYSGIFWVLGRYDRPWGPTRPIFGTVRYMSSANTARKHRVTAFLRRYGDAQEALI